VNRKKLAEVLDTLKNRITYFEDIREVDDELVILLENLDVPLPLSSMGDGFKTLLKLSFMAPLIKNGIVLFEEPETSMHPGYLNILAREIISSSEYSQIFISTHSLELIEYLLEKAEKSDKIESIKILRLLGFGMAKVVEVIGREMGVGLLYAWISWELAAFALLFSFSIGVLAGFLPSRSASQMDPVDALRHE